MSDVDAMVVGWRRAICGEDLLKRMNNDETASFECRSATFHLL